MGLLPKEHEPQKRGGDQGRPAPLCPESAALGPSHTPLLSLLDGAVDFSLLHPNGQRLKGSWFRPSAVNLLPGVVLAPLTLGPLHPRTGRRGSGGSANSPGPAVDNCLAGDFNDSREVVLSPQTDPQIGKPWSLRTGTPLGGKPISS